MIWFSKEDRQATQETMRQHVVSEILSACPGLELSPDNLSELAMAVTTYCAEQGCDSEAPSDFLSLLLCRALRGIGEEEAARQVEKTCLVDGGGAEAFDQAWPGALSADTWSLFASRLMRPSRWFSGDGKVMWVLDFSKLAQNEDALTELAMLPALRVLLERMSQVWDASGGKGTLGLRGLPSRFSPRLRSSSRSSLTSLPLYCEAVLSRIREHRGWSSAPRIIKLDLPVSKR
ncbi:MAG TPA: hypothetical protein DCZ95_03220 [Verrucomicrobia bacterium]|nr:MAG: hypothetical protein A2X46_06860 [Lentisphaerae bacterium GWF2_57_35]HBA83083.1 hypothetical protein [Verrucomicrobiota bacterium]